MNMRHKDVTIAASGQASGSLALDGFTLCGLYMPAAFTGTTLTFQAENGKGTFLTIADGAGSDVSKTVAASKYIKLDPSDFAGVNYLKIVSGSIESADRVITLALREIA
jgi:hypothetical protein